MGDLVIVPYEENKPLYSIWRHTNQIYKIVKFHRSSNPLCFLGEHDHYDSKLSQSFSRSKRMVLEYGLCNPWSWFGTFTISESFGDRTDLDNFYKQFTQFIRDQRKKYKSQIKYLLVPEPHEKPGWHMHGFISGITDSMLSDFIPGKHPLRLCGKGYKNWDDFGKRFGFCSLSPIRDPVASAFYITKYVSKDLSKRGSELGSHLYYASMGLKKADKIVDLYANYSQLDAKLSYHGDFVSTGMTHVKDGLDWTFPLSFDEIAMDLLDLNDLDILSPCEVSDFFSVHDSQVFDTLYVQESFI